jgi:hypothetical protein
MKGVSARARGVCVCVCVCVRARAYVRERVRACVPAHACSQTYAAGRRWATSALVSRHMHTNEAMADVSVST